MKSYEKSELNKVKRGSNRATYNVEEINTILDAGFIGFVGYNYNNKAISIPMAYARIDNKIYLHGSKKNRMLLALLENKEASMTVMHLDGLVLARSGFHHSVNYRSATLFGNVVQVDDVDKKTTVLERIINHMIADRWNSLRPMNEKEIKSTLVVEIEIETASAKIRAEGVKDKLSDMSLPVWAGIMPLKQVAEFPISDPHLSKEVTIPKHVLDYYNKHKHVNDDELKSNTL